MATIADALSEYSLGLSYDDLPRNTVHAAKRAIIDAFGCAIGAFDAEPAAIARKAARNMSTVPSSTLLGTGYKTEASLAAFANGVMARYFDYNDTYENREFSHPNDNVMPIVAVAEAERKTGRDVILATVLAYELQCRLVDSASLWRNGWDHVNYGLVSVALATGRLMGLSKQQMVQALNIALSSHITMRQVRAGELSMWKGAAFANAARNAVFSAALAREGMTGPSPIFEGEMGVFAQLTGRFGIDTAKFGGRKRGFRILDVIMKYFPVETAAQSAVSAALEVRKRIKSVDEVAAVEIGTTERGYRILGKDPEKWAPKTRETADHSLPYIVGAALADGGISTDSFSRRKLNDRRIAYLMGRTKVNENKAFTRAYPRYIADEVVVRLAGGKVLRKTVRYQKGHPKNPMSDMELEQKFLGLTARKLKEGAARALIQGIWNLEGAKDLSALFPVVARDW